jgi:Family of unknown function (DUF6526)
MATEKPQSFENHVRQIPIFALGNFALFVNLVGRLVDLRHGISFGPVMDVLVSAALIALFVMGRNSVVAVQDRVIRLEMRLRLSGVLPPDLCSRIPEFTVGQLVSLRFACDAELPELARKVLDEKLDDRKAIKKLIRNWQADYLRA